MRDRRPGLLLLVGLLLAGCQASPAVSLPGGTSPPSATVAPSVARTVLPAPSPTPIDYDRLLYGDSYAPTAGRPGGKVIVAEWQAATQLDPWYSNAFPDFEVLAATMRTLLRVTADGHYEPDLSAAPITYADSVRRDDSGDGFTVHVALKPGLTLSDGVPMTLNDLRYTWQWVNDPAQVGITPSGFEMIDRAIARHGHPVFHAGQQVGVVTSGTQTFGPQRFFEVARFMGHATPRTPETSTRTCSTPTTTRRRWRRSTRWRAPATGGQQVTSYRWRDETARFCGLGTQIVSSRRLRMSPGEVVRDGRERLSVKWSD